MKLTTKGRYALRAMLRLASAEEGEAVSLRRLSESEEISVDYLNQLFFLLRKAGLVKSTRGATGGFSLDRDPAQITVKDILEAVGEEFGVAASTANGGENGVFHHMSDSIWTGAAEQVEDYFAAITLERILENNRDGKGDLVV